MILSKCKVFLILARKGQLKERMTKTSIQSLELKLGSRGGGVPYIFWVRGRAIGKGIDLHDFGIRNGITFRDFNNWYWIQYPFSENWYKVGYISSKNWYEVGYASLKNWYMERVCF